MTGSDVDAPSSLPLTLGNPVRQLPFGPDLLRAVADLLLTTTFEGVWLIDVQSRTTLVNHCVADLLGYSIDEMLGATILEFMDEESHDTARHNLSRRQAGVAERHEFRGRRKDGSSIWLLVTANPAFDRANRYAGSLALIADLSVQKAREAALLSANQALEDQLAELSAAHDALLTLVSHDPLTGLYNRRYLEQRLTQEVARCRRHERSLALLFIDVDRFKAINDSYGHAAGDEVLCHLARVLTSPVHGVPLLRTSDLAARLGGDELVVLATEGDVVGGHTLAGRVLSALKTNPVLIGGVEVSVATSIGVASCPAQAFAPAELLAAADPAMYRAK